MIISYASCEVHLGEKKCSEHRAKPQVLGFKASMAFILQVGRVDTELACWKNRSDYELLSRRD